MTPSEAFTQALSAQIEGQTLTLTFATPTEAIRFRHSCNSYRRRLREANEDLPSDSPLWGRSIYDDIAISLSESTLTFKAANPAPIAVEVK